MSPGGRHQRLLDKRFSLFPALSSKEKKKRNARGARSSSEVAALRLKNAYWEALRTLGLKRGGLRPHEIDALDAAAAENALSEFETTEALVEAFAVAVRGLRKIGRQWTLRAALNRAGETWTGPGRSNVDTFDAAAYRAELQEIAGTGPRSSDPGGGTVLVAPPPKKTRQGARKRS